jgi:hypothetical protein
MIEVRWQVLTAELLADESGFRNNVRDALTVNKYWFHTAEIKGEHARNHDHCFG